MKYVKNTRYNMIARIGCIISLSIIIVDTNDKVSITICGILIGMCSMLIMDSIFQKKVKQSS